MMNESVIFRTPKAFSVNTVKYFLENVTDVFRLEGKQIRNVLFDVLPTSSIDLLGQLLIYKFMDFTRNKNCFFNPKTSLPSNRYVSNEMKKMGFKKLVDENYRIKPSDKEDVPVYSEEKGFFIAPIVLERNQSTEIDKYVEKKIRDYYSSSTLASGILQCIGEISSNFQEHAVRDTRSVLVARGNAKYVEIACADNGDGIVSSLSPLLNGMGKKQSFDVLRESIKENVTSKASSGHMGCGLWLVNEFVTASQGEMRIFSQNASLMNQKGKIKCGFSPYWKGTIIYVNLPLTYGDVFSEVLKEKEKMIQNKHQDIELNFV